MTFNPEMLVLAREARGLSQTGLASKLRVVQGTVSKLESGISQPTDQMIQEFCWRLEFAPGFFYLTDRVYGFNSTVFFHRRRQSASDRLLRKLHAKLNILRMRVARLLKSAHVQTRYQFDTFDIDEYDGRVERIAQLLRSIWLLPMGPVRSVVRTIEDAGGIIYKLDFETTKIDAISEWIPGHPPLILVNSRAKIPPSRLRFTLSHELGHLAMHNGFSARRDTEDEANRFAGEFLMPRKLIKPYLYRLNLAKLADLKQEWMVAMSALVYHAHRLETITDSQFKYLNMNLRKRWGIQEPLEESIVEEKPSLLQEIIGIHVRDLGYSPHEMAHALFYVSPDQYEEELLGVRRLRVV